jgi:predicted O-linked N-acetylglucosamine transferase (SPINDLY family)
VGKRTHHFRQARQRVPAGKCKATATAYGILLLDYFVADHYYFPELEKHYYYSRILKLG